MLHLAAESEIQLQIAALPPALREPFVLHMVREIPVKEVASQLGLTPANVRKRVQLARASLRRDITNSRDGNGNPQTVGKTSTGRDTRKTAATAIQQTIGTFSIRCVYSHSAGEIALWRGAVVPCFSLESAVWVRAKNEIVAKLCFDKIRTTGKNTWNWPTYFTSRATGTRRLRNGGKCYLVQSSLPPVLKLGDTLLKLGGIEMATEIFKNARHRSFQSAATVRHLDGWIALCQKNGGHAVMEFQAAAELEPENPVHWHGLALAHRLAGATCRKHWRQFSVP